MGCRSWVAVALALATSPARGQGLTDPRADARVGRMPSGAYDVVVETTVARQRKDTAAARPDLNGPHPRPPPDRVDAAGIGGANTLTAIDLAKASVSGSVEGVEAGASITPFPLLGWDTGAHQAKVTLAALKDGVTRLALGYANQPVWMPGSYADIGLEPCPFDAKEEKKLRDQLEERRAAFRDVCEILVASIPAPPPTADVHDQVGWQDARHACGLPGPERPDDTLGNAAANFVQAVKSADQRLDPAARAALDARAEAVRPQLDLLRSFQLKHLWECRKDEIADAYARTDFHRSKLRWGIGGQLDLFPIVWGFNPDPTVPLTHGEPKQWLARAELSYQRGPGQVVVALGTGESRASPSETFHLVLSPSLSFAWVLGAIGREPLYQGGRVRVQDGAIVPHVNVGLLASVDWAPKPPSTQKSQCEAVNATAFLDFVFANDLAVRLGVPLTAKLVSTKEGVVPKTTDLQWSLPAYVAMILKR